MTKKEFIINKIKEACPELSDKSFLEDEVNRYQKEYDESSYVEDIRDSARDLEVAKSALRNYTGTDAQLNHLLKTISASLKDGDVVNCHINMCGKLVFKDNGFIGIYDYDLSKTVDENLDDHVLAHFLAELLGYTE